MKRAYIGVREQPYYRRDAFASGLRACGYDVRFGPPQTYDGETVYVSWNRYSPNHELCTRVEKAGGIAIIAENGYVGPGGVSPHQMEPRQIYALAIGGHNGSGTWNVGGPERWNALSVDLKPWRAEGDHVLVCPNRPFGRPDLIMPVDWADKVVNRLRKVTNRPIRVRAHPGNGAHKTRLDADLKDAWACVIWSSSAGVQALIAGVPVLYDAPKWIAAPAGFNFRFQSEWDAMESAASDYLDACRRDAMECLAWAQWHHEEIASGEPFRHLLRTTRETEVAASA